MKFKVGQLVLSSKEAAAINQGPTYIVESVCPDWVPPGGGDRPRPYYIRQINGEPIALGTNAGEPLWYRMKGAWAGEWQLRALPNEEAADTAEAVQHRRLALLDAP